jgi:hypothetical protein
MISRFDSDKRTKTPAPEMNRGFELQRARVGADARTEPAESRGLPLDCVHIPEFGSAAHAPFRE